MFYDIRRRKRHSDINQFSNLRTNIYKRRVTNNVTQQFEAVHGSDLNLASNQNHMSYAEGLKRAYDSHHHINKLFVAGTKDFP